jgi:NodT family efflux transporter outer membrane factor (OMF) lipoprotein
VTEASSSTDIALWWQAFNDALLTRWVEQALQTNRSLEATKAALQQARAQRDVTYAGGALQVRASGSAQRGKAGNNPPANVFKAGFDASWEPDVFGAQDSAQAASDADVEQAAANLGQARVSLAAEVAVNTIQLRGYQVRLRLAQENLARQLEALQLTQWRVQAGLASSLELAQAKAASEQTRASLPALETNVAQTLNALAVLTGRAPGSLQLELSGAGNADTAAVPLPPSHLALAFPTEVLRQRPDLHAAEQKVLAAWARVHQADANRYPSLSLSGSLGLSAPRLGDLFDLSSLTRSVLASVTASLLDGGAAKAQVRVQQAALEQARLAHEQAVLTALQDVEDTLVALRGDRERVARLEAAVDAAAQAELMARQRYASGLIDYATLLDTQRTLLSVQSDLETTRATWSADHVRLYKALGGGWRPGEAADDVDVTFSKKS